MSTLESIEGTDDYFGDSVLSAPHLNAWLNSKSLLLPVDGYVKDYDFLQVRSLLGDIWLYILDRLPVEKAYEMMKKEAAHPENLYPPATRMQVANKVRADWRAMFIAGVESGELVLLAYASKLPVSQPGKPAAPAGDDPIPPLTRPGIKNLFPEVAADAWRGAFQLEKDNGLKACRIEGGAKPLYDRIKLYHWIVGHRYEVKPAEVWRRLRMGCEDVMPSSTASPSSFEANPFYPRK